MDRQGEEDGIRWSEGLNDPLPGEPDDDLNGDEIDQMKYL